MYGNNNFMNIWATPAIIYYLKRHVETCVCSFKKNIIYGNNFKEHVSNEEVEEWHLQKSFNKFETTQKSFNNKFDTPSKQINRLIGRQELSLFLCARRVYQYGSGGVTSSCSCSWLFYWVYDWEWPKSSIICCCGE